jgi:hypothetical protein
MCSAWNQVMGQRQRERRSRQRKRPTNSTTAIVLLHWISLVIGCVILLSVLSRRPSPSKGTDTVNGTVVDTERIGSERYGTRVWVVSDGVRRVQVWPSGIPIELGDSLEADLYYKTPIRMTLNDEEVLTYDQYLKEFNEKRRTGLVLGPFLILLGLPGPWRTVGRFTIRRET